MINFIKSNLKNSKFLNIIRNKLLIKPSIYLKPSSKKEAVSDFFFWNCKNSYKTKFYLTNLSSQILPDIVQNDIITIIIFDNNGILLDKVEIILKPFETREFFFDKDIYNNKYGSFFVFHKFDNLFDLISNGCHVAERGYTGYKKNDGVWNFVHGNHYSASLNNGEIRSLISTSLLESNYKMQVSFVDSINQQIVINNPDKKTFKYKLNYFGSDKEYLGREIIALKGLNTIIHDLKKEFKYLEIKSNVIFCRPLIIKHYDTYFDIFHA